MEWSEKAGIIWIDETMSSFYILLPNSEPICLNLGCSTRPTASFFVISKNLPPFQSLQSSEYTHLFTDKQLMSDGFMEAENFINLMCYHQLIEWFKSKPKFMEFSAEDNLERREFLNSAKCLGGIHLKEFRDDIEYVFINRRQESQSNHIPHLMKLKDLANCKFIGYGDDYRPSDSSVNLEEWFLQVIICKSVEDNLVKNFDAFRCRHFC
ncbi:hypothetical protein C2G38_703627 [Gigaspora rosea]|uniref:Uncharacterized protein n=1 Tax=Gigaspora rosea TaxID=44941 RepID=A0A397U5Y9_9GLOM|nr:hypothetical protein C2G38_703627 [Gigaspora rosea]